MKIKVSEATGMQLDRMVEKCLGLGEEVEIPEELT